MALDCIPLYLKIYLILYYHKMHDFIFTTFQLLQLHYFFAGTIRVVGNKKGLFSRNRQPKMAAYKLRRRYHNLMNISIANNQQLSDLHDLNFIPQLMQSQRHDIIWIHNSWNLYKIYNSLVVTFTVTLQHFLFFQPPQGLLAIKKDCFLATDNLRWPHMISAVATITWWTIPQHVFSRLWICMISMLFHSCCNLKDMMIYDHEYNSCGWYMIKDFFCFTHFNI